MTYKHTIQRYRRWYAKLLRLYSKPYYERFGEGMEQTFNDLLRERAEEERRFFGRALWMFVETFAGIIRENITFIIMQNITKRLTVWAVVIALILMRPLVAMQFTDEVVWGWADFAVAGALLFAAGLMYELVARTTDKIVYRVAVGVAVVAALLLVWMNLAVGIIGSEDNLANLMYIGVLAVGIIGAIIARLQPHGMARALFVMALMQAVVAVIALIAGWGSTAAIWPWDILILTGFFAALWLGSGLLFRHATRNRRLE